MRRFVHDRVGYRQPCVGAAACAVGDVRFAAMRAGDAPHDRETESHAPCGTGPVGSCESLEGGFEEPGRESGSVVADMQLDGPAMAFSLYHDRIGAVSQRVFEEVSDCLFEAERVGLYPKALRSSRQHDSAGCARTRAKAFSQSLQTLTDVDRLSANRQAGLVG